MPFTIQPFAGGQCRVERLRDKSGLLTAAQIKKTNKPGIDKVNWKVPPVRERCSAEEKPRGFGNKSGQAVDAEGSAGKMKIGTCEGAIAPLMGEMRMAFSSEMEAKLPPQVLLSPTRD